MHEIFFKLKHSSLYFAMYMVSIIMGSIIPYNITVKVLNTVTSNITFGFTNLPGPKYPLKFKGKASKKAWIYFIPVGRCGISIGLYSHNGIVKLGICADEAQMKNPIEFVEIFEQTMTEVLTKSI